MNSQYPLVSVIIPVYNGEKYIVETIESVIDQTYKNIEIIIINDGSTDNSFTKIKPYLIMKNIKYFEHENRGVAASRNVGIRESLGDLISFLDQDDLWLAEKIEKQVKLMKENKEFALVHSKIGFINENGNRIKPLWEHPGISGYCFKEMFSSNKIAMLTVLVKRECIIEAGMFDEKIAITDDYDLWLKITYNNPIGYIDEPIALYRSHGRNTSMNVDAFKKYELQVLQNILIRFPEIKEIIDDNIIKLRLFSVMIELCKISKKTGNNDDYNKFSKLAFQTLPLKYLSTLPRIYIGYILYNFNKSLNLKN